MVVGFNHVSSVPILVRMLADKCQIDSSGRKGADSFRSRSKALVRGLYGSKVQAARSKQQDPKGDSTGSPNRESIQGWRSGHSRFYYYG